VEQPPCLDPKIHSVPKSELVVPLHPKNLREGSLHTDRRKLMRHSRPVCTIPEAAKAPCFGLTVAPKVRWFPYTIPPLVTCTGCTGSDWNRMEHVRLLQGNAMTAVKTAPFRYDSSKDSERCGYSSIVSDCGGTSP
jgi:hypothetical protein